MSSKIIHLHDVLVESSSNPHDDLPDDTDMLAQLIVNEIVLVETVPVKKDTECALWKMEVDREIPTDILKFSIAIVRVSASKGIRLLGLVEMKQEDISMLIEQQKSFSVDLARVDPSGPPMKLSANFSVSSMSQPVIHQTNPAENQFRSLNSGLIAPEMKQIYQVVLKNPMDMEPYRLSMMYQRILLLPNTTKIKSQLLNLLGNIYVMCYQTSQDLKDLNQALCIYADAVQGEESTGQMGGTCLNDLGLALLLRFKHLGVSEDINRSISVLENAVQLTPDDPNKSSRLNNLGNSFFCRFEQFGDLYDIDQSIAMFEEVLYLTPDGHPKKASRLSNLGNCLLRRFEQLGDLSDIMKSVSMLEDAIKLTPDGHPDKPTLLNNLGNSLLGRFEFLGDFDDINTSVLMCEKAVQMTPDSHPKKSSWLNNLGNSLLYRFQWLGDVSDIEKSILICQNAVQLTPDGHPDKPSMLNGLGNSLLEHFQQLGDLNELHKSVLMFEKAVELTPDGHPNKASWLGQLGKSLKCRFTQVGDLEDIHKSVAICENAIELTPDSHPNKPATFDNLGYSLLFRFEQIGNLDDINNSVMMLENAVQLTPDGHPKKASWLNNLGNALLCRFHRFGGIEDINNSILMLEDAARLIPDGHHDKLLLLNNLSSSLLGRFEQLGNLLDINKSVLMLEDAIKHTSDGHYMKSSMFNNLGNSLLRRFQLLGDLGDLKKSILMFEDAIHLISDVHYEKPTTLNNFGISLLYHFKQLGDLGDLNKSIIVCEEAIQLTPDGHPEQPSRLNHLGNSLLSRFEWLGDLSDINKSIMMFEDAIRLTPDRHPDQASWLNNLGNSLLKRFEFFGDLADIKKSVLMYEEAVQLTSDDHPKKPLWLNSLGNALLRHFQRLGNVGNLNKSILMFENAVRLAPDGHSDKLSLLNNLANSLLDRFRQLGHLDDINKSIMMYEKVVQLTSDGHPDKPTWLYNLGQSFLHRFEKLGTVSDINKSVLMFKDAVKLTPDDHPRKPAWLTNLGISLVCRYELGDNEKAHQISDLETAILHFTSAASSNIGSTSARFNAASLWAKCAQTAQNQLSLDAYAVALQLLSQLAWLGLSIPDRHHHLLKAGAVVRDAVAAAIELKQYETAVEWLEQGRSVVWGQLLQLRTSIDHLQKSHPILGNQLKYLSQALEGAGSQDDMLHSLTESPQSVEASVKQYHHLAQQRDELLKKIRTLAGFEMFLFPKKFSQLITAAHGGPVITVNVSTARCDALILLPDCNGVLHIPLKQFTYENAEQLKQALYNTLRSRSVLRDSKIDRAGKLAPIHNVDPETEFRTILSQLWESVVRPILNGMTITTPSADKPLRIWWSLTGPLAFLPIHAAGDYGKTDLPVLGMKLSDYAVSSYTPTLTALINDVCDQTQSKPNFLAVALPLQSRLPCAQEEINIIDNLIGDIPFSKLIESEATIKDVLRGMQDSHWVHFACHGVQDVHNPTKSALLLAEDARLTLLDITRLSLPNAELAYLSACQTATGSEDLSEEAIHLTASMLFAGYRGVIGTMWSIRDEDAPQVADAVYTHLFNETRPDPTQAAFALHEAVKKLQDGSRGKKSFLAWVPYIHVGN